MTILIICVVAFVASALTFFSGFGLGTLLLPAFAAFLPIEQAVASTAVVHFLNGLFKFALVGRHADRGIVVRFGLPAVVASMAGAWALVWLSGVPPVFEYSSLEQSISVTPAKLVVGLLLLIFAIYEILPESGSRSFAPRLMPVGGVLSGFFGGISGMQGALRTAFLVRAGLSKEAFIGTGVVIACLIDITRLATYAATADWSSGRLDFTLLVPAVCAALLGTVVGNAFLKKTTMPRVQRFVAVALIVASIGLITGWL